MLFHVTPCSFECSRKETVDIIFWLSFHSSPGPLYTDMFGFRLQFLPANFSSHNDSITVVAVVLGMATIQGLAITAANFSCCFVGPTILRAQVSWEFLPHIIFASPPPPATSTGMASGGGTWTNGGCGRRRAEGTMSGRVS